MSPDRDGRRPALRWSVAAVVALVSVAACRSDDSSTERARPATTEPRSSSSGAPDASSTSSTTATPPPSPGGQTTAGGTPVLTVEVIDVLPHRADAFTQGLELHDGVLYESTGRAAESELAALDARTGRVLRSVDTPGESFGEGLTVVGNRITQLTWQDGVAFVWEADSLELLGEYTYAGEGWGLCHDGQRFVMSDGSAQLTFREPGTFEPTGTVTVRLDGEPVGRLNELECVADRVFANVWHTDTIMEIDPASGDVTTVIDASELRTSIDPVPEDPEAVLNGIAHDPASGTFLVTGKLWPQLFEVRFVSRVG